MVLSEQHKKYIMWGLIILLSYYVLVKLYQHCNNTMVITMLPAGFGYEYMDEDNVDVDENFTPIGTSNIGSSELQDHEMIESYPAIWDPNVPEVIEPSFITQRNKDLGISLLKGYDQNVTDNFLLQQDNVSPYVKDTITSNVLPLDNKKPIPNDNVASVKQIDLINNKLTNKQNLLSKKLEDKKNQILSTANQLGLLDKLKSYF